MSTLSCAAPLVSETLDELRAAGRVEKERVVLWLSPRPLLAASAIVEIYVPEQEAEMDYFRIPPSGMKALMAHLRERKLVLAAQVHSHPNEAFHSRADNKWAIVRHEGALSIVVPHFAAGVGVKHFLNMAAVFRLSGDDQWLEVRPDQLDKYLRLT
jgi:proteasome lid subunit RPN8/RPN11